MHLLDVNLLLALGDPQHANHRRARGWFLSQSGRGWATCPITENGFVRILSQPAYPGFNGDSQEARLVLDQLTSFPGHQFWPADLSLLDSNRFPDLASSKHLTDQYLLALAVARQAQFATLDRRIDPSTVPGGNRAYSPVH